MAIDKSPEKKLSQGDLQVAPKARSLGMAVIGTGAALWALVSLIKG